MLGLSGGIDSALVAYLVAEAIGAERLLCVLMPYRTSSPASRGDAEEVVRRLGCAVGAGRHHADGRRVLRGRRRAGAAGARASRRRRCGAGNFMARMRMSVLYDRSVDWRGLVVGTGNKTESLIGYTTLFGDRACAFNPIGDLYKSQVRQLSAAIGVPEAIIRKAPSADLWPGQTDETEAGFTLPRARPAAVLADRQAAVRRRDGRDGLRPGDGRAGRPDGRGRRVQAPGAADRQARAADRRRRLPVPAAPARLGPTAVTDERGRRRRRARCTSSRRPIGNLGDVTLRALEVLRAVPADRGRGHADHAGGSSTATRSRRGRSSYHARSGAGARARAARAPARAARTSRW